MPIQPAGATGIRGSVEIDHVYADGLKDLGGFSHIILIYHLHLSSGYLLQVRPFMDDENVHGIFPTRAPRRPNPIGMSVVKLLKIKGHTLYIEGVDVVDGTPLLDIKPCVPEFDVWKVKRTGWLSKRAAKVSRVRSGRRFK
jgi:tRNA-Thr(GGU) m(6)t(6)A37 methyltransferase TsaA